MIADTDELVLEVMRGPGYEVFIEVPPSKPDGSPGILGYLPAALVTPLAEPALRVDLRESARYRIVTFAASRVEARDLLRKIRRACFTQWHAAHPNITRVEDSGGIEPLPIEGSPAGVWAFVGTIAIAWRDAP